MRSDFLKYKLKRVWKEISDSGKCDFEAFEEFEQWSYENGFKPWRSLVKIISDDNYSRDNCLWMSTVRGPMSLDKKQLENNLNDLSKCLRYLEVFNSKYEIDVRDLERKLEVFKTSHYLGEDNYENLMASFVRLEREINNINHIVDGIDTSGWGK